MQVDIGFIATSSNVAPARGGRRRIVDIIHQTKKYNHKSILICFLPFTQVLQGYKYLKTGKDNLIKEAGIKVHYIPQIPLTRYYAIYRINIWYCALLAFFITKSLHIKILYGHGTLAGCIANKSKTFQKKIKIVTDFHGASAEEYLYSTQSTNTKSILKGIEKCELLDLEMSDNVIFVSQAMKKYYENKFKNKNS